MSNYCQAQTQGQTPQVSQDLDQETTMCVDNSQAQEGMAARPWDPVKAQQFLNLSAEANSLIGSAYAAAQARVNEMSLAYADAWSKHTGALQAASARQQLVANLIMTAALTFVAGAAGPFISSAMQKLTTTQNLVDGAVDLGKWAITQAGTAVGAPTAAPLRAFPTDPAAWQNLVEARLNQEKSNVYGILAWWQGRVNAQDASFNLDMNPVNAMRSLLRAGGTALDAVAQIDVAEQSKQFERGFWASWVGQYGYQVTVGFGGVYYAGESVPKEAKERLVALCGSEEAATQFVVQHGATAEPSRCPR